jgi:hypothetical protein
MESGSAKRDTVIGPSLSLSIMARRVESPSAWKTLSMFACFPFIYAFLLRAT